jgi:hypothetical protein
MGLAEGKEVEPRRWIEYAAAYLLEMAFGEARHGPKPLAKFYEKSSI